MKNFLKKPLVIILLVVIIIAAAGIYFYYNKKNVSPYQTTAVQRGDISQIVSVTGAVTPAESVDLAFQLSGRVSSIAVNVGDQVTADQILATLDKANLAAQIAQAQAGVAAQEAQLAQLEQGTRPEVLQIAQTNVTSAQKALDDAQTNLNNVRTNANTSLQQIYNSALSAAANSVGVAANSLYALTDIQYSHFTASDQNSIALADAKANAVAALLGGVDAGRWTSGALSQLNGGADAFVQNAQANPIFSNIDKALTDVTNALALVKAALEATPITTDFTDAEKTSLSAQKSSINSEVITANGKQQAIDVQKATNQYNITTAQNSVSSAQNALASAQDQLALDQAGSTPEQIAVQVAQVKSAQANVAVLETQLAETTLRAPIAGVITRQDAKIGEIVSPNVPVISVISTSQFQIEANVSEADIAKVKVGQDASITLDAYGNGFIFSARTIKIDPAQTEIEGVATYKVTLQFLNENKQIKSGLTANIDILAAKRTNVLIIPQRAVIENNNEQHVLLALPNNKTAQQKIVTGLKGSDGNIEVVSGLTENQQIVSYGGIVQ